MRTPQDTLKLVDGSQLAHVARSIHMFKNGKNSEELRAPDGEPTTILKGTMNILSSIAKQFGGDNLVVAYDGRTPSWRYEIYPTYKGGVKPRNAESSFSQQLEKMPGHLKEFGIATVQTASLEADDILAILAERDDLRDRHKILVSDDRDILAYVGDKTHYYSQKIKTLVGTANFGEYTQKLFKLTKPVPIGAWSLFRAMVGDSSDNIKGVPNCGPSTAADIVTELDRLGIGMTGYNQPFAEIESGISEAWAGLSKKTQQILSPVGLNELKTCYTLVQVTSAPRNETEEVSTATLTVEKPTSEAVREKLSQLGFKQWVDDQKWIDRFSARPEMPKDNETPELF